MPEWLREWWPVLAFLVPFLVAVGGWGIRKGLVSRDEFLSRLAEEAKARQTALAALDERVSKSLQELERRTLTIETEVKHLPTADDIAALSALISEIGAQVKAYGQVLEGQGRGISRIEDYLLKRGQS